ncbi:MAG: archease [Candidatus Bathyarchaeota archaeon]|nr:archease [Candidatus Bathyarchaeota archaeon]
MKQVRRKKKFEFLEHVADIYIVAYGRSLEQAFENAALATFEVMTDTDKVDPTIAETVEVEGSDEEALLYSWLENLLVRFDVKGNLYAKFNLDPIQKEGSQMKLRGTIYGEKFDAKKHPQKVGVKAVTYHRMQILKSSDEVSVKFILDV